VSLESMQSLVEAFGESLGLPNLAADAEGYLCLSFDDLVVHLQHEPEDDEVAAFARIGGVEEDRALEIYQMLLAANQLWAGTAGATLSVQPEDQTVFIAARKALPVLNEASFQAWLGDFVDITGYWTGRLARVNAGGPVEDPDDASEPDAPAPPEQRGGQGIIRG
jgi:hypothetical protein